MKITVKILLFLLCIAGLTCRKPAEITKAVWHNTEETFHLTYPEQWRQKKPFRFLFVSDTQNPTRFYNKNNLQRKNIYNKFLSVLKDTTDQVEMVFHGGDFVETGKNQEEWQEYFDEIFWKHLTLAERKRFFPAIGNHDYKTHKFDYGGGNLFEYDRHFSHLSGCRYYFFIYGNTCFIVMNSGRNGLMKYIGGEKWQNGYSRQVAWIRKVIFPYLAESEEAENIKNIFLFFHKPGYITPIKIRNRQSGEILEMFDEFNKVSNDRYTIINFTGHFHSFAHIFKDYDDDGASGIDLFIAGIGGGRQWRSWYLNWYQRVTRFEDLDLYRQKKYRDNVSGNVFDHELFDELRADDNIFGYVEVIVNDDIRVIFHRFDEKTAEFYVDYEFVR